MTQNVVTYTVEVMTDNSDGKLLPYLTANVQFELSRSTDVLLVPNAALRWFPQASAGRPAIQGHRGRQLVRNRQPTSKTSRTQGIENKAGLALDAGRQPVQNP